MWSTLKVYSIYSDLPAEEKKHISSFLKVLWKTVNQKILDIKRALTRCFYS